MKCSCKHINVCVMSGENCCMPKIKEYTEYAHPVFYFLKCITEYCPQVSPLQCQLLPAVNSLAGSLSSNHNK